jgi:NADH:ubiquinone oxidoreductase subunit 5 (subunit L)/multisubunit Na+/H+ antiporter MnhA subunit
VFTISQFGDVFFLLGSCLIISTFGASDMFSIYNLSFVFSNYFLNVMSLNVSLVSIVAVSFIFAMLLKSAQFVFYP